MADNLAPQQVAELAFWTDLVKSVGPEYYYAYRCAEYYDKTKHFPSFLEQKGLGLDYGCGCLSVFEPSSKAVSAFDQLWSNYEELLLPEWNYDTLQVSYSPVAPSGTCIYDWVACLNMIDHTPEPIFNLTRIWHLLKHGGRLYFEVNFEAGIAPPHYKVWNEYTVIEVFSVLKQQGNAFEPGRSLIENVPEHNQRRFWQEFVKF